MDYISIELDARYIRLSTDWDGSYYVSVISERRLLNQTGININSFPFTEK